MTAPATTLTATRTGMNEFAVVIHRWSGDSDARVWVAAGGNVYIDTEGRSSFLGRSDGDRLAAFITDNFDRIIRA